MPFLLTHLWPGGTAEQYDATVAALHPAGGLPPGQVFHAAGPTDGGILVTAVWNSKEEAETFLRDVLLPNSPVEGGLVGPPEEHTAETINVQTG